MTGQNMLLSTIVLDKRKNLHHHKASMKNMRTCDGLDFQESGLGFWKRSWVGLNTSKRRIFFRFCQIFAIFDDFSKWSMQKWRHCRTLKNIKNDKKWRKALFNLDTSHLSHWFLIAKTQFLRPVPPLMRTYNIYHTVRLAHQTTVG